MKNLLLIIQFNHLKGSINMNLGGIDNKESCKSPESGGSSMNWVMGHLIAQTPGIYKAVGLQAEIQGDLKNIEKYNELYGRGKPNVSCDNAIDIKEILELYNSSHDKIIKQLEQNEITGEEDLKLAATLAFHEAYHDGQIATLRRVLGKDSVIK